MPILQHSQESPGSEHIAWCDALYSYGIAYRRIFRISLSGLACSVRYFSKDRPSIEELKTVEEIYLEPLLYPLESVDLSTADLYSRERGDEVEYFVCTSYPYGQEAWIQVDAIVTLTKGSKCAFGAQSWRYVEPDGLALVYSYRIDDKVDSRK